MPNTNNNTIKNSNGVNKKIKNVILLLASLLLLAFIIYYFWSNSTGTLPEEQQPNYFEFTIMRENMAEWDIEKSQKDFQEVEASLEEDPDQLNGWLRLGGIKKHVDDYKGAEEAWIKAGEIRSKNSTSFGNLADLYANFTQEYDKAEFAYKIAIINSLGEAMNVSFYRSLYYFYLEKIKDEEQAESILLQGIEDNPKSDLLFILANFYRERGKNQKAIDYYQRYLEYNPDSEKVKKLLDEID